MFATLPLLLQMALVLFLAGPIAFTIPLGLKLAIPIPRWYDCTSCPTPLFSTHWSLLSRHFSFTLPCKFPHLEGFRTFFSFLLYFLSPIWPKLYYPKAKHVHLPLNQLHLFPHIYTIWSQKSWPTFDREWLSLTLSTP
ncbi:hypothetical protein BDN70DRAFT_872991 [Pholiota conissans]|uniref:Uncharacterized protein n=1 Tax=Pholiota conissans TaxID=109636 RepID=A0A9P5ZAV4_9AGAR|nr:hypothetical protein BDN70DRAFT_872991 [Pholiota conissans]